MDRRCVPSKLSEAELEALECSDWELLSEAKDTPTSTCAPAPGDERCLRCGEAGQQQRPAAPDTRLRDDSPSPAAWQPLVPGMPRVPTWQAQDLHGVPERGRAVL